MASTDVLRIIQMSIPLFDSFAHVYLFGSALFGNVPCNDIDLLLIYAEYSEKIGEDMKLITDVLEKKSGIPIDLTVLSAAEEEESLFLQRLKGSFVQIK